MNASASDFTSDCVSTTAAVLHPASTTRRCRGNDVFAISLGDQRPQCVPDLLSSRPERHGSRGAATACVARCKASVRARRLVTTSARASSPLKLWDDGYNLAIVLASNRLLG